MVSFSAPVTGGRVSTSNPGAIPMSVGKAVGGVALMLLILGAAVMVVMEAAKRDLPLISSAARNNPVTQATGGGDELPAHLRDF